MQAEYQAGTHNRNARREVEGTLAKDQMLALPRWESFPLENRHHLVGMILQAARRQVVARPANNHPSR
jgi:hypothetical protein